MGYDIQIMHEGREIEHIYTTYNHYTIFKRLNVYPRDFNDQTVADILPEYQDALLTLTREIPRPTPVRAASVHSKYMDDTLYEETNEAVLRVLMGIIAVLQGCPEDATWVSD